MAELLVELLTEDIPARMQVDAAEQFCGLVTKALSEAGLTFENSQAHSTPRRLALAITGLPVATEAVTEEKRGPRSDAPQQAVEGFLRGHGLNSADEAEIRETPKGSFYFAVKTIPGRETADVLPGIITEAIKALTWPKSMRWGTSSFRWVRPLRNILAIFDGKTLTGGLDLGGEMPRLDFNSETLGHRFMAPDVITVTDFADYKARLEAAKVILDRKARKAAILEGAEALAKKQGLQLRSDKGLLEEVAGLVEFPVPIMGRIDAAFMDVPAEPLITSMRKHQRYFSCLDDSGKLAPFFITIANMVTKDGGETVIAGNEKVLRARLADAKFFWDQDRMRPLEDYVPRLSSIVYHKDLGTVADRAARLQSLAADIARITGADIDKTRSAAGLCKADLVTNMVVEFTDLQGVMGGYYAQHSGEDAEVAAAISTHYSPAGPNDDCPTAPASVAVALADKIDALTGFFAIDMKPTGSSDPYALRRAALGVIRIILENGLRLPLTTLFEAGYNGYLDQDVHGLREEADVIEDLVRFFGDRLTVMFRDEGFRHDMIAAVFALGLEDDLMRLRARVEALRDFLASDDGSNLLAAYRRAANILRIEEKKDQTSHDGEVDEALLKDKEERKLSQLLEEVDGKTIRLIEDEAFASGMGELAKLKSTVDAFFDSVTVNADDEKIRANRLALLASIRRTMNRVADFSKIEG